MIRKKKLYTRPRKVYIKTRIAQEVALIKKYGLKNKKEIWKALARINYFRSRAKALAKFPLKEQKVLFDKLKKYGLKTDTIADVLALNIEDLLARRLPTIMVRNKLAATPQQARQMIVHKKVLICGKVVNIPSYIVSVNEESLISTKPIKKKAQAPSDNSAQRDTQ
jgi:small subunit ribosomal protein S4